MGGGNGHLRKLPEEACSLPVATEPAKRENGSVIESVNLSTSLPPFTRCQTASRRSAGSSQSKIYNSQTGCTICDDIVAPSVMMHSQDAVA